MSGNWGCGAFNGDIRLKFLIQWIACSMAKKELIYIPFGQKEKLDQRKFIEDLETKQISEVYKMLVKGGKMVKTGKENIFDLIMFEWFPNRICLYL